MKTYLKTYKIELKTLAPVYIGSGDMIGKKEYIYEKNNNKVIVPNLSKMYIGLKKLGKISAYEEYMLNDWRDLSGWLRNNNITKSQYMEWIDYTLDSGNAVFEEKSKKEIHTFIKDAYGNPYIPGSSLKGVIRNVILCDTLLKRKNDFLRTAEDVKRAECRNKKNYLSKEIKSIEVSILNTIDRKDTKKFDMVNDCMSGIRVSDSYALDIKDMVLCQKIDVSLSGDEKPMPMLRECIKPGVRIAFDLTIDTSICKYSKEYILNAVNRFFESYKLNFLDAFLHGKRYSQNIIYLGGGCGYVSKTVTYPLFGKKEGVRMTSNIFNNTLSYKAQKEHKHFKDVSLGVSPHVLKCTKYNNHMYEFGMCEINIV